MKWKIIDTGFALASENMALDLELLLSMRSRSEPILHFYDWEGRSATFGHFIDPYNFLDKDAVVRNGLNLAKRPTGGGIIFHLSDFAFSILVPANHPLYSLKTLENYAHIHAIVAKILENFLGKGMECDLLPVEKQICDSSKNFCMAKPTIFDLMLNGKKVGGAAQRRTKYGFLHQGSISLSFPPFSILEEVLLDSPVLENMKNNSYYIIPEELGVKEFKKIREELKNCFLQHIN